jgi:hypothetical protein
MLACLHASRLTVIRIHDFARDDVQEATIAGSAVSQKQPSFFPLALFCSDDVDVMPFKAVIFDIGGVVVGSPLFAINR